MFSAAYSAPPRLCSDGPGSTPWHWRRLHEHPLHTSPQRGWRPHEYPTAVEGCPHDRDALDRRCTTGGAGVYPPPPLPMLEADSQNYALAPSVPRGSAPQNSRPAFGGDHRGTLGDRGSQPNPPPPPPPLRPPPPSNAPLPHDCPHVPKGSLRAGGGLTMGRQAAPREFLFSAMFLAGFVALS